MKYLPLFLLIIALICAALMTGCTAQQWETTKAVAALPVLISLAVIAESQPIATTTCKTVTHGYMTKTVCNTY